MAQRDHGHLREGEGAVTAFCDANKGGKFWEIPGLVCESEEGWTFSGGGGHEGGMAGLQTRPLLK